MDVANWYFLSSWEWLVNPCDSWLYFFATNIKGDIMGVLWRTPLKNNPNFWHKIGGHSCFSRGVLCLLVLEVEKPQKRKPPGVFSIKIKAQACLPKRRLF